MKKRNRFLALLLTVTLSLSLSACGGSKDAEEAGASVAEEETTDEQQPEGEAPAERNMEDVFAAAQQALADVTSLDAQMIMEMDMEVTSEGQTESMHSINTMAMTTFTDPFHIKIVTTVDMGDQGTLSNSIYAETDEDGSCTMYMYDGSDWTAQAIPQSALGQQNAASDMQAYVDGRYDFEEAGIDQIDGSDAYRYTTVLSGDQVKETMLSSGALDTASQYGLTASDMENMMDGLGEIPISLWIDADTLYPVKYELDMTDVMDTMMSRIPEALAAAGAEVNVEDISMHVPKMTMSMTCFHYNAATDFEVPEEAKVN